MNKIRVQSVVYPERKMDFNQRSTHILNEVLKSKGLKPIKTEKQ